MARVDLYFEARTIDDIAHIYSTEIPTVESAMAAMVAMTRLSTASSDALAHRTLNVARLTFAVALAALLVSAISLVVAA